MHVVTGVLARVAGRSSGWSVARIAIIAGVVALFAALGLHQAASAEGIWTTYQPANPDQAAACVSGGGIHSTTRPAGERVQVQIVGQDFPEDTPIHQIVLASNGATIQGFCVDIEKAFQENVPYCGSDSLLSPQLLYVMNTYPPTPANSITQAARQAAVWHFANGVALQNPDATTGDAVLDAAVLTAYDAILANVAANANPANPPAQYLPGPPTMSVVPTNTVPALLVSSVHTFTVSLTNGGQPLPGYTIDVTSTLGTLNKVSGVTDSQGKIEFTLTSPVSGTAFISTSAVVTLPGVQVYQSEAEPEIEQPIGSAAPRIYDPSVQASATWISPTGLEPEEEPRGSWLLFLPALDD